MDSTSTGADSGKRSSAQSHPTFDSNETSRTKPASDNTNQRDSATQSAERGLTMANPEMQTLFGNVNKPNNGGDATNNQNVKVNGDTISFDTAGLYKNVFDSNGIDTDNQLLAAGKKRGDQPPPAPGDAGRHGSTDNKKLTESFPNGTNFERTTDASGTKTDLHTGPRPESNFTLTETKKGQIEVKENGSEKTQRFLENANLKPAREALLANAEKQIKDPALLSKFKADMVRFENRAAERNLPDSEIQNTYKAVNQLLDKNVPGKLPLEKRTQIAEQIMNQAATPTAIDQGQHNTCNVATVEARTYTRHPAAAANFVSEAALTGKATLSNGTVVKMPENGMKPDSEAATNPPRDGERSFASQLFQVAAINGVYTDGKIPQSYDQVAPTPGDRNDTGERHYDTRTNPPKLIDKLPGLSDGQIAKAYQLISGEKDVSMIEHTDKRPTNGDEGVAYFGSAQELRDRLTEAKNEGRFPLIMAVDANNEPFRADSGAGTAGGSAGGHVITITDFDPATGQVKYDNQWGSNSDHLNKPVDVNTMFYASMDPAKVQIAKATDQVAREHPELQGFDQNLAIMDKLPGTGLGRLLNATVDDESKDFRDGKVDSKTHRDRSEKLESILDRVPLQDKPSSLFTAMLSPNTISPEKFQSSMIDTARKLGLTAESVERSQTLTGDARANFFGSQKEAQLYMYAIISSLPPADRARIVSSLPHEFPTNLGTQNSMSSSSVIQRNNR